MMFMYVMMVVAVVTIWGLRHGDVTHHVYPTVITVGLALLVAEARMWLSREWFWGLLSTVYVILLFSNAVLMSTYGIWSFFKFPSQKLSFEEKGTMLAWVCLAFSILLWIIALVFFFQRRSDSERSPADSRNENSPCDFLHVFDEHDIWHITSSFALFFFFVALLTMDDDLCQKSSQEIKVT
uniref:Alkaline ceramidase n=1 Tax=Scylla olivacea TaxID=85551 RepID=A0A0P4WHI8_SCYOL